MFANLANAVAASSADKFVDTPKAIITSVNSTKFSFAIPSCPATSITFAISVAVLGISLDISRILCLKLAYSSSVASTVFFTPANADSNSLPALTAATTAAPTAAAAMVAALVTVFMVDFPKLIILL